VVQVADFAWVVRFWIWFFGVRGLDMRIWRVFGDLVWIGADSSERQWVSRFVLRSALRPSAERWRLRRVMERPKAEALGYLEARSGKSDRALRMDVQISESRYVHV
jgi:hypothetical protein